MELIDLILTLINRHLKDLDWHNFDRCIANFSLAFETELRDRQITADQLCQILDQWVQTNPLSRSPEEEVLKICARSLCCPSSNNYLSHE